MSFEVNHPTIFTLKMDRGVCSTHTVINAFHPSVVLVPTVPLLILNFLDRELALTLIFIAFGVPHLLARLPTAARFAEVCAEYALHPLHRRAALGAIATSVPPTAAFDEGIKGSENNADAFTKNLDGPAFEKCIRTLVGQDVHMKSYTSEKIENIALT